MEKTRGRSLSVLRSQVQIDHEMVKATTAADTRRHLLEDGLDPDNPLRGFRPVLKAADVRQKTGLSQDRFARAIGVPVKTIQNWEQGRSTPDPAVQALLKLVASDPEGSLRVLAQTGVDPGR